MLNRQSTLALRIALSIALFAPLVHAEDSKLQVNGRVEKIGPFRTLRVWGTPQEMGFAHGYLEGMGFVSQIRWQASQLTEVKRAEYEGLCKVITALVMVPANSRAELDGIIEGIRAANGGELPRIDALNREIKVEDFIVFNGADMLRAYGCSGYTLWGEAAGKEGVVTTRNFDYHLESKMQLGTQMILVRHPKGRQAVATITWPGYIGAFTGVNESGQCTFMHDGTGDLIRTPTGPATPVALVLKDILEQSVPGKEHTLAKNTLEKHAPYPFSYMVRVVAPRHKGSKDKPVRVYRMDGSGISENLADSECSVTTNHYLNPDLSPVARAGEGSLSRYQKLQSRIKDGRALRAPWEAQASVASHNEKNPTLHTVVVYPESRRLMLGFATYNKKVIPATGTEPTTIEFDRLFKR